MAVTITHSTPADGTFSATGAAAWDASHSVSGLGTMAEQNSNNVNITGGSITGVTGVLTGLTVNSTPTSGGAAGQIMFDTGSVLQESSNLVWDNTNKKLTITGATVTTSQPVLDMTQTWNDAGTTFTGLKLNVTDTASNASSLLMDLQVGGTSKAAVSKAGIVRAAGIAPITGTSMSIGVNTVFTGASTIYFDFNVYGGASTLSASRSLMGNGFTVGSTFGYNFSATTGANGAPDLLLTRRGAANLRLGAADAAAPVAQTLSVQSVVAGTSNTAGANLTITGSQGTGTGAGGSIIFQVAPAGSSGTAQNALTSIATLAPSGTGGSLTLTGGTITTSQPVLDMTQTWNAAGVTFTGLKFNATDTASAAASLLMDLQVGGSSLFAVRKDGSAYVAANKGLYLQGSFSTNTRIYSTSTDLWIQNTTNYWDFSSDGGFYIGSPGKDLQIRRRAAATLQLGAADAAAPVAQTLSVQSVVAGTSNTAGANLTITGSQGTGTGAGGSIIFQVAPSGSSGTAQNALTTALTINSSPGSAGGAITVSSNLSGFGGVFLQNTSNAGSASTGFTAQNDSTSYLYTRTYGTGVTGASVWGTTLANYAGVFSDGAASNGLMVGTLTADPIIFGTDTTEKMRITSAGLITFGGSTSSFPALKRSTTILQVRLADDSAYAPVEASTVRTATAYTVATLPAAGTAGRRAYVTDATAPTFLGALIGGGTVVCPVFDDGAAWVAG